MKIKNNEIRDKTVEEIGRFAILWNWFENSFCNNNCNYKKLKERASCVTIDLQKQNALAEVFAKRSRLGELIIADYVKVGLYPANARNTKTDEDARKAMETFINQQNENTNLGCLMAIYRVRCNMMHGLKGIEELDGQYELFRAINDVLESIR